MKIEGKSLWMIVDQKNGGVVYAAAPDRVRAYAEAGKVLGDEINPLSTADIKAMGYKAVKVTQLTFSQ